MAIVSSSYTANWFAATLAMCLSGELFRIQECLVIKMSLTNVFSWIFTVNITTVVWLDIKNTGVCAQDLNMHKNWNPLAITLLCYS